MARVLERPHRKRKMNSHLYSFSGDNSSICSKSVKVSKSRRTADNYYPSGHVSTVFLGGVVPKFMSIHMCSSAGDNAVPSTSSSSSETLTSPYSGVVGEVSEVTIGSATLPRYKPFRFECRLGDIWQERYNPSNVKGRRKVKVTTGEYEFDVVATKLSQQANFVTRELLSKGKMCCVVLSSSTEHNRDVVIKYMKDKSLSNPRRLMCCSSEYVSDSDEVTLLRQLSHPNIIQMLEFRIINNIKLLFLEFCDNGNIEMLLQSIPNGLLSEHLSRKYLSDVTAGVEYLHYQSIAHCAITGQHVLLDRRNRARICGFGGALRHTSGTPALMEPPQSVTAYQAPEAILKQPIIDPKKLDVWAVGVLLYRMVTGHFIYGTKIKNIPFRSVQGPHVDRNIYFLSDLFHRFLEEVLVHDPEDRPSIYMARNLGWLNIKEKKVRIGYHYLVSRPARGLMSTVEKNLKEAHGI